MSSQTEKLVALAKEHKGEPRPKGTNGDGIEFDVPGPDEAIQQVMQDLQHKPATDEQVPPEAYKDLREAIGWTVQQVSEATTLSPGLVESIESGKTRPDGMVSRQYRVFAAAALAVLAEQERRREEQGE